MTYDMQKNVWKLETFETFTRIKKRKWYMKKRLKIQQNECLKIMNKRINE